MNVTKIFKNLIILDFVLIVLAVISGLFSTEYEEELFYAADYFALIILIAYIINLYLLYRFKPIARSMFVLLNVLGLVMIFFYPLTVWHSSSQLEELFYTISSLVPGALLAILFCSEVSEKFNKK